MELHKQTKMHKISKFFMKLRSSTAPIKNCAQMGFTAFERVNL